MTRRRAPRLESGAPLAFCLVARLLGECQRLDGDLQKVVRGRTELGTLLQRLKDLEMQMEEKRKRMR